jgi:hypothetical protein
MGKIVGLVGALTTVGAVAYLMAPLPQSATSSSDPSTARFAAPAVRLAATSRPNATPELPVLPVSTRPSTRGEPTAVLVQQIQAELHRLGCYGGAIDGQWTDATQRAMQALGERVSVLRPVDSPDYIMLALARSQAKPVCASAQRTAAAGPRDKWKSIATPEIAGKGEQRPTSGKARVAATEQPKVWRAVPEPKRTAARSPDAIDEAARQRAARDELNRIEMRKHAATVLPEPPTADQSDLSTRPPVDTTRMSLGVAPGDPLQAHVDPRNPNAPAILRAPAQPLHGVASQTGDRPAVTHPAPQATIAPIQGPPTARAAPPPARVTIKQARRAWQRTVFTNMQFNGP